MNQSNGIFPRFKIEAYENKARSREEGRAVFGEREMIEIHIAGDSKTTVCRKVTAQDKERWPEQYKAFKANQEQPIEGTPINEWPAMTVSKAAELKALHILTVEALAELSDNQIRNLGMGGRELVAQAKAFLDVNEDQKAAQKYAAENEALKTDLEALQSQVAEMSAIIDELKGSQKDATAKKSEAA